MTGDIDADFLRAKEKIKRGTDFRDTIDVEMGDEEVTFGFRLLNESEFDRVSSELPTDALQESAEGESLDEAEQERLEELSERDPEELSDEEQEEMAELAARSETGKFLDALDDDANDMLRWAGKKAILPCPSDVEEVMNASFSEQVEILGRELAEDSSRRAIEQHLAEDIEKMVENQPFRVKKVVGLRAFIESLKVQGNGVET